MPFSVSPTVYPEINAILRLLLSNVKSILGERFVGMYLCGSLATGDFDPRRSDVDFVVVTDITLTDEIIEALAAMHNRILATGLKWAAKLEGSYVPLSSIRRHNPAMIQHPRINEGVFQVEPHGSAWDIQRHIIRERGVVVAGPIPLSLIDPLQPDDLRRAVLTVLREFWEPTLQNHEWLSGGEYQAFAILTMCRALYTLQHGIITSKPVSARWAQETLGDPWGEIVEQALSWERGCSADCLRSTLDFIRYTLEQTQQLAVPASVW